MEPQQSHAYANYIRSLGWVVETIRNNFIYIKKIPFSGAIAKIQRTKALPTQSQLEKLITNHRIRTLAIEPDSSISQKKLSAWLPTVPKEVKINTDYFLPTKTIRIDLSPSLDTIFQKFSEAKRRAVRRAQKNDVTVVPSADIKQFIKLKNKSVGFLGSITTFGLDKLWPNFAPENATVLFAYNAKGHTVGGIFLLYHKRIAYYWIAGATREGKKLFAPTLLVWHALQEAKGKGAKQLDFVGVWDERLPKLNRAWLGFTKFKEGFGGTALYYPLSQSTE